MAPNTMGDPIERNMIFPGEEETTELETDSPSSQAVGGTPLTDPLELPDGTEHPW